LFQKNIPTQFHKGIFGLKNPIPLGVSVLVQPCFIPVALFAVGMDIFRDLTINEK